MSTRILEQAGFFSLGVDSLNDPAYIGKNNNVWSINTLNRGGIEKTRPGFNEVVQFFGTPIANNFHPQGGTIFTGKNGITYLMVAEGGFIHKSAFPFVTFQLIPYVKFNSDADQIIFETAIKSTVTNADGSLTFVDPYPVLMMQDGTTKAAIFDGQIGRHVPVTQCPIGQAMKWCCNRLWVGNGNRLHASNLGDPIGLTEENITAEGGFFVLPGDITAISETPDLAALLVFTDTTTTSFQAAITDRTTWSSTPNFQQLLFRSIGCVGPKAVGNQWGVTWWYSHNGVVSLDLAYQTYRSSRIVYRDVAMTRSKRALHKNLRRICFGQFENFVMFSVPSGDQWNAHTWVMDQTSFQQNDQPTQSSWAGIWKGIRPVEWITTVVQGVNRCICISRDYWGVQGLHFTGIWEAFCRDRVDTKLDGTSKPITCLFEGRVLCFSADPKKVTSVELDVSDIIGTVNFEIFVAGRRSPYTSVGTKQVIATQGSLGGPLQQLSAQINLTSTIESYLPQRRIIRSQEILMGSGSLQPVQSNYIPTIDLGFQVAVTWTGDCALNSVRLFADPQPEAQIGTCEADELTDRIVSPSLGELIETTIPGPRVGIASTSGFVEGQSGRIPELFYSSR